MSDALFFAHKKRITERNSHLEGEASGSSISNSCQAKTECCRQLAGAGTGRGGTKLHASAPGSRVTAFFATAAPWEPYFMDNLRNTVYSTFTNSVPEHPVAFTITYYIYKNSHMQQLIY
jgi:hypothetical protein